jgi:biotin carboxyl carrier protein
MRDTDLAPDVLVDGEATHMNERLIIAPCAGRFVPLPPTTFTTEGEWIEEGETIAEIQSGNEVVPVVSIFSGWVMGMLAVPGQPVQARVALFRVRP